MAARDLQEYCSSYNIRMVINKIENLETDVNEAENYQMEVQAREEARAYYQNTRIN